MHAHIHIDTHAHTLTQTLTHTHIYILFYNIYLNKKTEINYLKFFNENLPSWYLYLYDILSSEFQINKKQKLVIH